MMIRKCPPLLPLLVLLVLQLSPSSSRSSWAASAQEEQELLYKVYANNLSDLKLDITLCTAIECVPKSPRQFFTLGPKQVAVYGPNDSWPKSYIVITDPASGKKFQRALWSGQLAPSNPANILSILPRSNTRTEVWFSDLSGKNVLLGVLS